MRGWRPRHAVIAVLLLLSNCAMGAVITASGAASTSSGANWVGGVAPNCAGDQIVTAGFAVTQNVAGCIIGRALYEGTLTLADALDKARAGGGAK